MVDRVVWSPRSVSQLENICDYIALDSPVYARIFAQKMVSLAKLLPAYPEAGRRVPEYDLPDLREKIYGDYRMVYRITESTVEIVAICHGARQLERALPDPHQIQKGEKR